ncbi:MAG TPA: serine protease [Candidatus Obscuribacter sp.]|nr:serine protease [Candidatus Obscuribacter sp.]
MSQNEVLTGTAPTSSSVDKPTFDADQLFREHKDSVVGLSDVVALGPNQIPVTLGSGFAIDKVGDGTSVDCRFATDNHVISTVTDKAKLTTPDGQSYPFEVELHDSANDLAILKVKGLPSSQCQPLELVEDERALGSSDSVLKLGARTGTVGSTAGAVETYFERRLAGHLPLLPGEDPGRSMVSVITQDRNSQSGDSGGPILRADGKVVAIMEAEGIGVIAGTPSAALAQDLASVKAGAGSSD